MKLFPKHLDAIVIWAVRRQEVQNDPAIEGLDGPSGDLAGVDDVVTQVD